MGAPSASNLYANSGSAATYGFYDRRRFGILRGRATFAASATATVVGAVTLPANAKVRWAQANVSTALVLSTATRWGIGTTADPDMFLHGSSTTAAGTISRDTEVNQGVFPIFTNQVVGTLGGASSTAAYTLTTFSGQTVSAIPANFLKPGDIIRMRGSGVIAWGTDGTHILKVLSGTDIVLQGPTTTPVDGDMFAFDVDMTITAIGTSGKFYSSGRSYQGTAGSAAGAADIPSAGFLTTTTLDTTAAFTPSVTGIFSTSQAAHGGTMNQFTIEVYRPLTPVSASTTALVVTALANTGFGAGTGTSGAIDYEIGFEEIAGPSTS